MLEHGNPCLPARSGFLYVHGQSDASELRTGAFDTTGLKKAGEPYWIPCLMTAGQGNLGNSGRSCKGLPDLMQGWSASVSATKPGLGVVLSSLEVGKGY